MPNKNKRPKLKLIKYGDVEGYAMSNIKEVMSKEAFKAFTQFMNGQTVTVYKNGDDLVFQVDLVRLMKRLPPLD